MKNSTAYSAAGWITSAVWFIAAITRHGGVGMWILAGVVWWMIIASWIAAYHERQHAKHGGDP